MAEPQHQKTRRTRFVCVSDTHNATSKGSFKLPAGDVLIHAGDLTNQGSYSELSKTVKWIEEADFECKIVIAGNHDITLDAPFYTQYGLYFHNQDPQDASKCQALFKSNPSITYLMHATSTIRLSSPSGPHTAFKVFGTPYSPQKGMWAFGYPAHEATTLWDRIPLDTDILIAHTPPKYHLDERSQRRADGCEALREALWRVRPRLMVCGHVHESRGAEIVKWDLAASNIRYKELGVERWVDPGKDNKKLSLVDLTARGGNLFKNDGATKDWNHEMEDDPVKLLRTLPSALSLKTAESMPESYAKGKQKDSHGKSKLHISDGISKVAESLLAFPAESLPPARRGQGGVPPSLRCDLEALSGRMGRKETCVVNAAIMASSWPHTGKGGKKFNKPIVVDIDLPVWGDGDDVEGEREKA